MERKYFYKFKTSLEHYHADAFTLRCIDDRYWKTFKYFLRSQGVHAMDPVSVAGGAKVLASPETPRDREFVLSQIEISMRLHNTKRALLFTHSDCGAYGGLGRFQQNRDEEFAFHKAELEKAKAIVEERFPKLTVEAYFLDEDGVTKID